MRWSNSGEFISDHSVQKEFGLRGGGDRVDLLGFFTFIAFPKQVQQFTIILPAMPPPLHPSVHYFSCFFHLLPQICPITQFLPLPLPPLLFSLISHQGSVCAHPSPSSSLCIMFIGPQKHKTPKIRPVHSSIRSPPPSTIQIRSNSLSHWRS